ncbi:MAG: hypothetical protein HOK81_10905 [Rhodospirillaceae bacterium]|jgi:hypothetical protein|nr:hypothetical protein [Rhodospirillaceae bacterium]
MSQRPTIGTIYDDDLDDDALDRMIVMGRSCGVVTFGSSAPSGPVACASASGSPDD